MVNGYLPARSKQEFFAELRPDSGRFCLDARAAKIT